MTNYAIEKIGHLSILSKIFSTSSRGQQTKNLPRAKLITARMGYLTRLKGWEYTWLIISELSSSVEHCPASSSAHSGSSCSCTVTRSTGLQRGRCAASDKHKTQQHQGCRAAEQGADFCAQPSQHSPSIHSGAEFTLQLQSSLNSRDN